MICEKLLQLASEPTIIAMFIAQLLAILGELWKPYDDLPFEIKRWLMFALCLVVPVGSLLLGVFQFSCEGMAATSDALAKAIEAGMVAYGSGQLIGHIIIRRAWPKLREILG